MYRDRHILVTFSIPRAPLLLSMESNTQLNLLTVSYELRHLNLSKQLWIFFAFAYFMDHNKHFGVTFLRIGALQEVPQATYTYTSQPQLT